MPLSILRDFDEKDFEMKKEIFRTLGHKNKVKKRIVNLNLHVMRVVIGRKRNNN